MQDNKDRAGIFLAPYSRGYTDAGISPINNNPYSTPTAIYSYNVGFNDRLKDAENLNKEA